MSEVSSYVMDFANVWVLDPLELVNSFYNYIKLDFIYYCLASIRLLSIDLIVSLWMT